MGKWSKVKVVECFTQDKLSSELDAPAIPKLDIKALLGKMLPQRPPLPAPLRAAGRNSKQSLPLSKGMRPAVKPLRK